MCQASVWIPGRGGGTVFARTMTVRIKGVYSRLVTEELLDGVDK